jgi:hypothetical protein
MLKDFFVDQDQLNFLIYSLNFKLKVQNKHKKTFNILAALVICRRDSDSSFVAELVFDIGTEEAVLLAVDGVLPFVCLFSFELAAKDKIRLKKMKCFMIKIPNVSSFLTSLAPIAVCPAVRVVVFDCDSSVFVSSHDDERFIESIICESCSSDDI